MPSYIGFRPQFNPVSLQEYLAVPTMIQQEFDTYEDKYNENLDKLAVLEGMTDESTRYLTDRYKDKLSNAADVIAGKSGNLSDLRSQINNARQYYRETAPRLTNAYNKRQAALKAQQDILLKDPSAVTTKVGNMQSFMDNPDQVFHSLSGDKIYADMINAGKLSAADLNNIGKSGITGYLAKMTGYTPQQQQEYAIAVQRALSGDNNKYSEYGNKTADDYLKNNPIYTQPYQVLSKYIEDNKFGVFDDSERAYVLNRALSGQLMGMTGHTDYMADKQWEHNSRMSAAKASQAQQQVLPPPIGNHIIKPIARAANYGRQKYGLSGQDIFVQGKDGKIRLNSDTQSLYRAIGWTSPVSAAGDTLKDSEIADIYFNSDGTLRTKEQANTAIKAANKKVGYNKYNLLGDEYDNFYMNLMERADMTQSFDDVITSGPAWRQTQSIDSSNRVKNFKNFLKNYANSLNEQGATNTAYYNYQIPIDNDNLKPLLSALPERFTKFTGMSMGTDGLTYNTKGGKAVKKADIIKKAEKSGATLELSPLAGGYVITINNEDEDRYFIPDKSFDRTMHNYTNIDWEGYDSQIAQVEALLSQTYNEYLNNPNAQTEQDYINVQNYYNNLLNQYNSQLGELERGLLESDVFTSINEYNPNSATFRK